MAGIHVIGDAAATTQPKAGHIGNQEGKARADAILRLFGGCASGEARSPGKDHYEDMFVWFRTLMRDTFA